MNKGLEALNKINSGAVAVLTPYDGWQDENIRIYYAEEFNIIENELKEKEKKDKALEIIKTKLLAGCFSKEDNYSNYAMAIVMSGNEILKKNMMTEKEYNLLKEVLL